MRPRHTLSLILGLALFTAACGDATDAADLPAGGADEVVASLAYSGGFMPVEAVLIEQPQIVVYGDGTVVAPSLDGRQLVQLALGADELASLHEELLRGLSGLPPVVEPDGPLMVADAPDSVLTVATDDGLHQVRATAVGLVDAGYPPALEAAQSRLQGLAERVQRDGSEHALDRARLVVVGPNGGPGGGQPAPWPDAIPVPEGALDATFDAPAIAYLSGAELERLLADTGGPGTVSWHTEDGTTYLVSWRQALRHER